MSTRRIVTAYPRLHFGLVDLSGASARSYGGAGAAFNGPTIEVEFESTLRRRLEIDFSGADIEVREKVTKAFNRAKDRGLKLDGSYSLKDYLPAHVGLGSTTATTMAFVYAASLANAWKIGVADLVLLSGRGRTSAVGSNTFFEGGLIIDAGQRDHPVGSYLPSLLPGDRPPSLRLGRWPMPANWRVVLMFTDRSPSVPSEVEGGFFAMQTPTDRQGTLDQLAALYHGMLPAVIEEDLQSFASALTSFQAVGFKAREISAQPMVVKDVLRVLWQHGHAAGLSSLGPTVFAIYDGDGSVDALRAIADSFGAELRGPYSFRNDSCSLSERIV